jgi:hypothetical protein
MKHRRRSHSLEGERHGDQPHDDESREFSHGGTV